ncbi:FtsX-like permease family protein [Streptomyces sp. NBC_01429]|uniref:FtsX-like permease family protein n=1 Tax=Streptomyces sp. NBC_01429 TaxID=2903862 RepID=UPI002E2BFEE3|nr:FtsX-like permease family protein [Streptomyces sp. NBC_01429]
MLAFRTLRFRKTSFVATFVSMFLGAAIVMACGGLIETGIRMAAPAQRLAAAPIVVTGQQDHDSTALTERGRIDAGLVEKVAAVPGVEKAIGDVSFPASVLTEDGRVAGGSDASYGHGWDSAELAPYRLTSGKAPAADDEVVLDAGLAAASGAKAGSGVDVVVSGVTRTFVVTGVAAPRSDAVERSSLFFSGPRSARLATESGRIDSIGVLPAPGTDLAALTDRVKSAVGDGATVLTGERRGLAELPGTLASQKTVTILGAIFGSFAVLVVMFGVASTLALSLQQRQREMALLRAIGTTPAQIRRMIVGETAALSLLATGLAIVPGFFLGEALFSVLTGSGVVSAEITFHEGRIPIAAGALVAIVAALGATLFAGRHAARTDPVAALAESAVQARWFTPARLILALFFLVNGIALAFVTATVMDDGPTLASTAGPASVLFSIGLALLAPGITKAIVVTIGRPVKLVSGMSGYLAVRNATTSNVRMAGAVAPIVLLVAIATGTLYMQSTEDEVSASSYSDNVLADYVLNSSTGGFAAGAVDRARAVSGVSGASELVTSNGFVDKNGGSETELYGVSSADAAKVLALDTVSGSLGDLDGNTVALSKKQAEKYGVGVGDTLPIHFGDGAGAAPKVVALYADNPQQEYLLLPSRTLAPHTIDGLPHQILIRADAGAADRLGAELDTLAASLPGTRVADRSTLTSENNQIQQILVSANYTIVAMIVGYAAITVVNTLVAVTRKRQGEFGLQRLTGATRAQVIGMLSVEGGLVAFIATVLGTLAAATTIVPYSLVKTGSPMPLGSIGIYLAIVGGALVLIFGATLVPSWRGMRTPPIETLTKAA